ncbi:MAG: cation diffusion facilitator family transporter [Bacilli bacterium]|nr:cation diffusion facilitator family transporter [Bacilli bacterium]
MKKEINCLIYVMINNFIISVIKIISGILLNISSLFADGLHTFVDFITDIISLIGIKISKKRPTKSHPFGFGRFEYLSNLFIGIILLLLSLFIIYKSFNIEHNIPNIKIIYILLIVLILKMISIFIMHKMGKKLNSQILITSEEESKTDLISSFSVIIIIVLLQYSDSLKILAYSDLIGSLIISIYIIRISLKIIINNSFSLMGELNEDEEKINYIKKELDENKNINKYDIELIKYGSYNKLELELEINKDLSLRQITNLEKKIKTSFKKNKKLKTKYVTISVSDKL